MYKRQPPKEEDGAEEGTDKNEEAAEIEDPDHGKSCLLYTSRCV